MVCIIAEGPDSPAYQQERLDPDKNNRARPRWPSITGRSAVVIPAPNPPYANSFTL
ncbi:hypothetical protein PspLS_00285 [Pyricularia sp. CBS 133598]|nr:hypothetical protein PspLS_00285 [Pyricularia sp. CBS 133598]